MSDIPPKDHPDTTKVMLLVAAFVFLYASVLTKLGLDWWSDENYSHGLLVPFVIGLIVWRERDWLKQAAGDGAYRLGGTVCIAALLLLLTGVLGAELFTTRISMVLMLAGIAVYLFGTRIVRLLLLPLALLVLAIPIPQILFNKISFPLQIWASRMAGLGHKAVRNSGDASGECLRYCARGFDPGHLPGSGWCVQRHTLAHDTSNLSIGFGLLYESISKHRFCRSTQSRSMADGGTDGFGRAYCGFDKRRTSHADRDPRLLLR
jgi:hypothetical protein